MNRSCLLNTIPLSILSGITPKIINKFAQLKLKSLQDLLLYLPIRYENRTKLYSISEALPGMIVTIQGKILKSNISFNQRRILTCYLRDNSGILILRFFHFNKTMKNSLCPGQLLIVYGEIRRSQLGNEIIHPEYRIINNHNKIKLSSFLTPIYSTISGVQQTTLRSIINQALKILKIVKLPELLPPELNINLISLSDALQTLHHPSPKISLNDLALRCHPAQRRLIFEELLAYNLSMLVMKTKIKKYRALPLRDNNFLLKRFLNNLPFSLTNAQQRVVKEIIQDLAQDTPMIRLILGDVGSGKTLVAALAALYVISNGYQVALMVPTELLAEQHIQNFRNWFTPLGIKVGCLIGKQKGKIKKFQHEAISNGQVSMIIGTHAIFQKQVHFSGLALVIIDEQHRFGVHQRLALWEKCVTQGYYPHQLIMTATPIPRTLAMISYAHLDISIINELPPGRIPVITVIIPNTRRIEVIQRIRQACLNNHRQVYWICTLIKESNMLKAQAAEITWRELQNTLPDLKIGLLHGRMKNSEKQELIQAFKLGKLHLLVATTVIEIGIDIPNASLMVIENPERLGLAQIHQLRGRIGRGTVASYCILLYNLPLSKIAQLRLRVLRESNDGFFIAKKDLEIRGPGELLGTRQTGIIKFRVVNLMQDQGLFPEIKYLAKYIYQHHPDSAYALIERWMPRTKFCTFV